MIEIDLNEDQVTAALVRAAAQFDDLTPLMGRIAEHMRAATTDRFPAGRGPDGTAWAAKSPATMERYRRAGDRADALPLFGPTGRLSSTIDKDFGADFAQVGSNVIQAAVMQWGAAKGAFGTMSNGAPIPWGHIPARPFLGLSERDRVEIPAIVTEWLASTARP